MPAAVPPRIAGADEPEIRLVNQRGRLERAVSPLAIHALRRELAQLVIHQRQEFTGGPGIAGVDRFEDSRDVGHGGGGAADDTTPPLIPSSRRIPSKTGWRFHWGDSRFADPPH